MPVDPVDRVAQISLSNSLLEARYLLWNKENRRKISLAHAQ